MSNAKTKADRKLKLMAIFLEFMKADLQTHTDGAWIPLHSDNRNISLNSVAVT